MKYAIRFALAIALLALFVNPVQAALPAPDLAVTGSFALGRCIDAAHQDMGIGKYVQAPAYFNPVAASDAQLSCYGFPPRPKDAAGLASWTRFMSMQHPKEWVASAPKTGPAILSAPLASRPANVLHGGLHQSYPFYSGLQVNHVLNGQQVYNIVQGSWIVPTYGRFDGHLMVQWISLGCCQGGSSGYLYQGGTAVLNPTCQRCFNGQTQFFWEVPHYYDGVTRYPNYFGPSISNGQHAAFVIWEYIGSTVYEACNESTSQCSTTVNEPYSDGVGSIDAEWVVEDAGAAAADPAYALVKWGPQGGPVNQNYVDEANGVGHRLDQELDSVWILGGTGNPNETPGYLAPTTIDTNTNFEMCPGNWLSANIPVPLC